MLAVPAGTRLIPIDQHRPAETHLNQAAIHLIANQHSAHEVSSKSVGGHTADDIIEMIHLAYWTQMTDRSSVLVDEVNDRIISAIICIPFHFLDVNLTSRIIEAIRSNDQATLAQMPSAMVEFMLADRHPEIVWLLAECGQAALQKASENETAAKFAEFVAHDKILAKGDQHWVEELGLIASDQNSPIGSMSGAISVLLEKMWKSGVKMALGHYNNFSASVAIRTGGIQLAKLEHRHTKSMARRPGESGDEPRFLYMETELDRKRGVPAEFLIVHDLDELAVKFAWSK